MECQGEFERPAQFAWCFMCDKRLKPRALRIVDKKTGRHICSRCIRSLAKREIAV